MKECIVLAFPLILLLSAGPAHARNAIGPISSDEAVKNLDAVIVDAASERNFEKNHFPDAVNVPIEDISAREAELMYKTGP